MTDKQTVKFGDICREVKLTTKDPIADGYERYIGLEHLDSGSLKVKRWGMIVEDNPSFTRVFKKGQILFGKRRPYLKKAAIAEFDGICSGDIIVMEPKSLIEPNLLPFIVQSEVFWDWAIKTSSGSLSPRTKFKALADYTISASFLDKQNKLLPLLESIKATIESCDQVSLSSQGLYHSIDHEIGKEIFSSPKMNLGQIALKADDGPFGSKLKTEHYVENGSVRVIRLQNIQRNYFDGNDEAYVDSEYAQNELSKHDVVNKDVLIAGLGDESYPVGRACVYNSFSPAINKADCFRIRVNQSLVLPEFLAFVLNSVHMRSGLAPFIQGVTRQRINLSNLKKLQIPVPTLEKQTEFVQVLTRTIETEASLDIQKNKLKKLLQKVITSY
ncbi:TPA: restriction endonuclease subunit S [Vibrio cholerae]|nr:restriction endonuclease subunit S [Vibrio cholerae]HAS3410056.1 restriction endonuclease subunit S [Vibrio cholerae]HDI3295654.1 restriction endonuclease subunit S [Vibrio cholerae]